MNFGDSYAFVAHSDPTHVGREEMWAKLLLSEIFIRHNIFVW